MTDTETGPAAAPSRALAEHLPHLRRYARALTGTQETGDAYAVATLEALLADPDQIAAASSPRTALFGAFHGIWQSTGAPTQPPMSAAPSAPERKAQARLGALTPNTREALLLHTIERLSFAEIAEVMGITLHEAHLRVQTARDEMADAVRGRVLIIEDEAIIAMDLESLVAEAGHEVMGIARTRDGASALASAARPDLILADIQLADRSSGIDAVNDLLGQYGTVPAIFITAFPERLLSGARPEPAFLIAKPFEEEQVRTAISQALFFASTETLAETA
jgi:DNA-directed RNA polymerase specialized sigma24 family protein